MNENDVKHTISTRNSTVSLLGASIAKKTSERVRSNVALKSTRQLLFLVGKPGKIMADESDSISILVHHPTELDDELDDSK